METEVLSYNEFANYIEILIHLISHNCNENEIDIDAIYGPPRGGLPIATHFSHAFDSDLILDLDDYIQSNIDRLIDSNTCVHIIICDDVCDSGQTFREILENLDINYFKPIFCSLYVKPRSLDEFFLEFFVKSVSNDTWLVFPWEYSYQPDKQYMIEPES